MSSSPQLLPTLKPQQVAFLDAFIETCSVSKAAKLSKIGKDNHYHWINTSQAYREAFHKAQQPASDVLQDEAVRRAVDGVEKLVTVGGEPASITVYSDSLLAILLKAWLPEKYKDRTEHSVAFDGDVSKLTDAQLLKVMGSIESRMAELQGQVQRQLPAGETIDVTVQEQSSGDGLIAD